MSTKSQQLDDAPEFNQELVGGEVLETSDSSALAQIPQNQLAVHFKRADERPRSIKKFIDQAIELVTLTEETASECIYALPRDGKTIEGPSARFAEILAYSWGNSFIAARPISEESEFIVSQGMFFDFEKNNLVTFEVKRRITDKRGNRFKADMIGMTQNAGSSIALRNAVFKGIPKALWKPVYDRARKVVAGDARTLAARRTEAVAAFQIFGGTPEMVFRLLGVKGLEDVTLDHIVTLHGVITALREGDTTAEEVFSQSPTQDQHLAGKASEVAASIKERYANGNKPEGTPSAALSDPPAGSEKSPSRAEAPTPVILSPEEQKKVDDRRQELERQQAELASRQAIGKPSTRKTEKPKGVPIPFEESEVQHGKGE